MTEPWRKLRLDVVDVIARSVEGAGSSWFSQALRRKVRSEHVALVGGEKKGYLSPATAPGWAKRSQSPALDLFRQSGFCLLYTNVLQLDSRNPDILYQVVGPCGVTLGI